MSFLIGCFELVIEQLSYINNLTISIMSFHPVNRGVFD